jgi:hypothetical protein
MADRKQKQDVDVKSRPEQPPPPHHVADEPVAEADSLGATVQSPTTKTGLPVEEQVRKEWDPKKNGGLPTPLRPGR